MRLCERDNFADTKVNEEGQEGVPRAEMPLQPMVKTMMMQAVTLQPLEVNGGADTHLQPMEDPILKQVDTPEGDRALVGSRIQAGSLDPWRQRTLHCSRFAGRTFDPVRNPHWNSPFLKDYTREGTHTGAVHEGL